MKSYQYKVLNIWFWSVKKYEEELNKVGREGWELFFVVGTYHYFRKEN